MTTSRILPVLLSIAVILVVAFVQERSKYLAAVVATMPVSAPLAMWVVYAANRQQPDQVAGFTLSMAGGILATLGFIIASWVAIRLNQPFAVAVAAGYAAWAVLALVIRFVFPS